VTNLPPPNPLRLRHPGARWQFSLRQGDGHESDAGASLSGVRRALSDHRSHRNRDQMLIRTHGAWHFAERCGAFGGVVPEQAEDLGVPVLLVPARPRGEVPAGDRAVGEGMEADAPGDAPARLRVRLDDLAVDADPRAGDAPPGGLALGQPGAREQAGEGWVVTGLGREGIGGCNVRGEGRGRGRRGEEGPAGVVSWWGDGLAMVWR